MRVLRTALVAGVLLAALGTAAMAQDEAATELWRFEARAVDYSAMLQSQHNAATAEPTEVALARVPVKVLVRAPGRDSTTMDTETDLVGRFVLEGPPPPAGATLRFFVASRQGEDARPGYYGRPWHVDDGDPPATIAFYQVAAQPPEGMYLANVINVVSTVDRDQDEATTDDWVIQVRHTAMLMHQGFRVWLGDLSRNDFASFGIRIPPGFELGNVTVDNQRVSAEDVGTSGHDDTEKWLYREPIFPSQKPLMFQAIFVAPYEEGREYDLSWHNELFVGQYSLNIEAARYTYLPPKEKGQGVGLADAGRNAAMGNIQIVTHGYGLQQIPPHQTLSARFMAGMPFPWKAVIWTGTIVLIAVGAGLLGYVASRSRGKSDPGTGGVKKSKAKPKAEPATPSTAAEREHELELLGRRLRRGEITSVEHDIRKAAILNAAAPRKSAAKSKAKKTPAAPKKAGVDVAAIAARVDDASPEQLREDVRALLGVVRPSGER